MCVASASRTRRAVLFAAAAAVATALSGQGCLATGVEGTCLAVPRMAKTIRRIMPPTPKHWVGDGFNVHPVFAGDAFTESLSPWLMFDYAAPKAFEPSRKRRGVGQHPHRGFETVTIAFQGEVEHQDSVGNKDVIGPGDVQWMTAGRGIIHEEYHSTNFGAKGGTFEMCQLWLNLPAKDKMHAPRYQPILHKDIPAVPLESGGCEAGQVRIIAGEFGGVIGPAMTFTPVELWDVHLDLPDAPVELEVPNGHNCIVFVRSGELRVGGAGEERLVAPQGVALMERDGTTLRLVAAAPNTKLMILGGKPLNEPIAAQGPFVMNTRDEIMQANKDFRAGLMGK